MRLALSNKEFYPRSVYRVTPRLLHACLGELFPIIQSVWELLFRNFLVSVLQASVPPFYVLPAGPTRWCYFKLWFQFLPYFVRGSDTVWLIPRVNSCVVCGLHAYFVDLGGGGFAGLWNLHFSFHIYFFVLCWCYAEFVGRNVWSTQIIVGEGRWDNHFFLNDHFYLTFIRNEVYLHILRRRPLHLCPCFLPFWPRWQLWSIPVAFRVRSNFRCHHFWLMVSLFG